MKTFEKEKRELESVLGSGRIEADRPLAPFTTFRIGGPADLFFEARSADELESAILTARKCGLDLFLLGLGANILVGDKGFRGFVVRNASRSFSADPSTRLVEAESGAIVWPDVIDCAVAASLSGLEHYAGIPSTVGGALWQNLHFLSPPPERERTVFLEEVVDSAVILTPSGDRRRVDCDYFEFGYDESKLHTSGDVVLSATFRMEAGVEARMRSIIEANLAWRRDRHPPLDTEPSAGSIFKKIEGIGAGRLIDECGMKGTRIGGVEITRRHANIMINTGGGTARDVRDLIELTVETVQREKGYRLEPEIAFVGEF